MNGGSAGCKAGCLNWRLPNRPVSVHANVPPLLRVILIGMTAAGAGLPAAARAAQAQAGQAAAAAEAAVRVVPAENVRVDYAQVLRVEPVYQTLRATRTEERCDSTPVVEVQAPREAREEGNAFGRMVESVKGFFTGENNRSQPHQTVTPVTSAPPRADARCQLVQVDRQFQRPIAYDVDYVYKGTKYRSRLAEDPGNRLRIRISVMPYVPTVPPVEAPAP